MFEQNHIYSNNFDDYHYPKGYPTSEGRVQRRRADRRRDPDRRRQRRHRPRQPHLRTTGSAARCSSPSPTRSAARRAPQTCTTHRTRRRPPTTTSFYDNVVGRAPGGKAKPNGVDFWWDEFPADTGNCWFGNRGPDGTNASWTGDPAALPEAGHVGARASCPRPAGRPPTWGPATPVKEAVAHLLQPRRRSAITGCDWYAKPAKRPNTAAAARQDRRFQARAQADGPGVPAPLLADVRASWPTPRAARAYAGPPVSRLTPGRRAASLRPAGPRRFPAPPSSDSGVLGLRGGRARAERARRPRASGLQPPRWRACATRQRPARRSSARPPAPTGAKAGPAPRG